jgi:hypothetical protein
MASKIKVDQIQTADGTGTIALQNQLSGMTTASLPTVTTDKLGTGAVLSIHRAESTGSQQVLQTTSWTDLTGVTVTLTPKSSSSKFLLVGSVHGNANPGNTAGFSFRFLRNGTAIHTPAYKHEAYFNAPTDWYARLSKSKLDEPNTASSITYKIQVGQHNTQTVYYNYGSNAMFASEIVIWEVEG